MHRSLAEIFPYVIPLLFLQVGWVVSRLAESPRASALALWVASVPLFVVIGLRGSVGTDTDTYRGLFTELQTGYLASEGFEPGFLLLARSLLEITDDPAVAVNLVSIIILTVMISAALRGEQHGAIFAFALAPTFIFDMSMNGLRYGLAFGLAQHAVCDLERRSYVRGAVLALLAVAMHSSAALVIGLLLLVLGATVRVTIVILLACLVMLRYFAEALATKIFDYRDVLPPSELSGIAPAAITAVVLVFLLMSRRSLKGASLWPVVVFATLGVATFGLARVSYAGIRFQLLVLFCMLVYLQAQAHRASWAFSRWALLGLWLIGTFAFALKARNFYDDFDVGPSPFLPYKFFGEDSSG